MNKLQLISTLGFAVSLVAALAAAPAFSSASLKTKPHLPLVESNGESTTNTSAPTVQPGLFRHIFVVVLENESATSALSGPFLKKLTTMGGYLSNFHANAHPSEPNYLTMVAGSNLGVTDDGEHQLSATNLADLLEAKGLTWKAYAEDLPGPCQQRDKGLFAQRHVPFLSFFGILNDRARCANIVDAKQLSSDIASGRLPSYAMYTPNLNNDGHDTGLRYADDWLRKTFGPLLEDPRFIKDTLFVVSFDEGSDFDPANRIYTVFYNPDHVKAGSVDSQRFEHPSLLRFIEDNFSLGNLGRGDATAPAITGVFQ